MISVAPIGCGWLMFVNYSKGWTNRFLYSSLEFIYEGFNPRSGYLYKLNGILYAVSENEHTYYQNNPQYAEKLFVDGRRPDPSGSHLSYDNNNQNQQLLYTGNKKKEPTNDEIANSQKVTSFKPNRVGQTSGQTPVDTISFPGNPVQLTVNNNRPLDQNLAPFPFTETTGYNKKIPDGRDQPVESPAAAITNFAWNLFRFSNSQQNYVLSPLSPHILLSYLAWVAEGSTRNELLLSNVFGSPTQIQSIVQSMLADGANRELQIATAFFHSVDMRYNNSYILHN